MPTEKLSANCPRDPHISGYLNASRAMIFAAVPWAQILVV